MDDPYKKDRGTGDSYKTGVVHSVGMAITCH